MTTFYRRDLNPLKLEPQISDGELTLRVLVSEDPSEYLILCNCDRLEVSLPGEGSVTAEIRVYDDGVQRMDGYHMGSAMWTHTTTVNPYSYHTTTVAEDGVETLAIQVNAPGSGATPKSQVIIIRRPAP